MVIVSAKVSKKKLLLGIAAALCVVLLLSVLVHKSSEPGSSQSEAVQSLEARNNDQRLAFLQSFGWQVQPEPLQTQEVRIPEEFNEVFTRYNQLQQSQGFDLSAYAGKTAKRYVYAVTNYPGDDETHNATVLVYKGSIIGGDVASQAQGGRIHGFAMPQT